MAESVGRREKDLELVEEFETVRAVTGDGRSVRIPKSKLGGNLETATETVLGGIKAAERTDKETVEAKIDSKTGKLFVPKGGNAPDDEDITLAEIDGEERLQFKDKQYDLSTFSGLGRKYLRKNMVGGLNVLTQSSFDNNDGDRSVNTRFVIQYDYDLNGSAITIPNGCVLDFQGGSLRNGTIIGNETQITGETNAIFKNISIDGTWNVPVIKSSMFSDIQNDDELNVLLKLTSNQITNHIYIDYGSYTMKPKRTVWPANNGLFIYQKENIIIHNLGDIRMVDNNLTEYHVICLYKCKNITFEGGSISGDKDNHDFSESSTHEWGHGIGVYDSTNVRIGGVSISDCTGDGVYVNIGNKINISHVNISRCRRQGISIVNEVDNVVIDNFDISGISGTAPASGIDIEPNVTSDFRGCRNISIKNGVIRECTVGFQFYYPNKDEICHNILIDNLYVDNIKELPCFFYGVDMLKVSNVVFSQPLALNTDNNSVIQGSDIKNLIINGVVINAPECKGFYVTGANNGFVHISDSIINVKSFAEFNSRALVDTSNITLKDSNMITQHVISQYAYPVRFMQCSIDFKSSTSPTISRCLFDGCDFNLNGTNSSYKVYLQSCRIENSRILLTEYSDSNSIIYAEGAYMDNIRIDCGSSLKVSYIAMEVSDSNKSTFGSITFGSKITLANGQNFLYPQGRSLKLLRNEAANSGNTANRPTGLANFCSAGGFYYYDFTIGRPIWWTGSKWINANGEQV